MPNKTRKRTNASCIATFRGFAYSWGCSTLPMHYETFHFICFLQKGLYWLWTLYTLHNSLVYAEQWLFSPKGDLSLDAGSTEHLHGSTTFLKCSARLSEVASALCVENSFTLPSYFLFLFLSIPISASQHPRAHTHSFSWGAPLASTADPFSSSSFSVSAHSTHHQP